MFMACHRIISYLGRRGCWVTAFNFAKLLYALDPLVSMQTIIRLMSQRGYGIRAHCSD